MSRIVAPSSENAAENKVRDHTYGIVSQNTFPVSSGGNVHAILIYLYFVFVWL